MSAESWVVDIINKVQSIFLRCWSEALMSSKKILFPPEDKLVSGPMNILWILRTLISSKTWPTSSHNDDNRNKYDFCPDVSLKTWLASNYEIWWWYTYRVMVSVLSIPSVNFGICKDAAADKHSHTTFVIIVNKCYEKKNKHW